MFGVFYAVDGTFIAERVLQQATLQQKSGAASSGKASSAHVSLRLDRDSSPDPSSCEDMNWSFA
jgi:hypothetical protein